MAVMSCVKNWPNITHKLDQMSSCMFIGSILNVLLNKRGFGNILPETLLTFGMPTPSSYSGESRRLCGVSIEPNSGCCKLLQMPSKLLYFCVESQEDGATNGHLNVWFEIAAVNCWAIEKAFDEVLSSTKIILRILLKLLLL